MKYIKTYEFVSEKPELKSIIKEVGAPLYHAIKPDRAIKALQENRLGGYSVQRYWKGGRRYKDDQPEYEKSFWMRGISTSRDIEYCAGWNEVIFVFDKSKLRNKYKIVPYNWGFSIGKGYEQGDKMKKEREEFIITGMNSPKSNNAFIKMTEKPNGYIEPLSRYLIGYFISERFYKYMKEEDKAYLELHPNFLGLYTDIKTKKESK